MKTANKKWISISGVIVLILALIFIVVTLRRDAGIKYEIYESQYTLESGYTFKNIQVCNMKDKDLEEKINESLNSYFYILIEPWFEKNQVEALEPIIHCKSKRYLSVEYVFEYVTAENLFWRQCITIDIETGEVVFFDDLIKLNEDFANLVKTEPILKNDPISVWVTPEERTKMTNDYFSKLDTSSILIFFQDFTRQELYGGYDKANTPKDNEDFITYLYCVFFYVEDGKICFTSANSSLGEYVADITYIMVEDIEEYLKVPIW